MQYREALNSDIPGMAHIRSLTWGTEDYWSSRIAGYLDGKLHPQQALAPRVIYVAEQGDTLVGLIDGHLTRRYDCNGELEWIDVAPEHRGSGVALELLRLLAAWFVEQKASRICVDCDPENAAAQKFYRRHGAETLNKHWLVWDDIKIVLAK
jgi:ribosomal protein S18 acetylase RimI-like enzyme